MRWALALALLVALPAAGCLQAADEKDLGPQPARGPCRALATGPEAFLLVQVRHVDANRGTDLGAVPGLDVNVTMGPGRTPLGTATTDARGCIALRLQGPNVYEAVAARGEDVCRQRGSVQGATDAENHLELTLRLLDPCP